MHLLPLTLVFAGSVLSAAAQAQEGAAIRQQCGSGQSHPEIRLCIQTKAEASARELRQIEDEMRKSLTTWDQEAEYIRRSKISFDKSVTEFARHRVRHCEFLSSLAAGGNSQGDLRLSCVYELNTKRILQIQQAKSALR